MNPLAKHLCPNQVLKYGANMNINSVAMYQQVQICITNTGNTEKLTFNAD